MSDQLLEDPEKGFVTDGAGKSSSPPSSEALSVHMEDDGDVIQWQAELNHEPTW